MRIALVIQKLAGLRGGAERVVIELAKEMSRRGHDVTIVTFEPSTSPPAYDIGEVHLVDLFPGPMRAGFNRFATVSKPDAGQAAEHALSARGRFGLMNKAKWAVTHGVFARCLARWLTSNRQDVMVGFLPPAISATAFAGMRMGHDRPRLIASVHNVPDQDFGDTERWDQNPVARERNLWALTAVDAVTVLQEEFVDQLPPKARDLAVVLPNAVRRLAPVSGVNREPLILGVGRLTDVKRFELLIRAFGEIANEVPHWSVIIYGDGPERARLQALVDEAGLGGSVSLPGSTTDLADEYDRASILCHPALYEGFGLSVAEAILHGVFVIASQDCVGVNRLVEHGESGLLVDEGDRGVAAFADALRSAIERSADGLVSNAAMDRLKGRLDPDNVYDRWEAVLSP